MASAPSPSSSPYLSLLSSLGNLFAVAADLSTLLCFGVFSFLIGLDVWRAFKKRASWLPGKAFALSGVTVQIIVWWTSVSRTAFVGKVIVDAEDLLVTHQIFVSGRVAVCVFMGYLLPGMAAPGLRTFVALGITICAQIGSELLFFQVKTVHEAFEPYRDWASLVDIITFIDIIVLALILSCTVVASKTSNGLLKQRVSAILSTTEEYEFEISNERTISNSWKDIEDELFTSWFVARACRADYVISRSVLSSAVWIVVTKCVMLFLLSNTFKNVIFESTDRAWIGICSPLFSFILIGWIVICWRWFSAQLYFRAHRHSWRRRIRLEDLWTSNTVQLIQMYDLERDRQRLEDDKKSWSEMLRLSNLLSLPAKIFTRVRWHKWLYLVLKLQVSVVFFCKVCGLLSEVIVGTFVFVFCFRKHTRKEDGDSTAALPTKYAEILKRICMPGEALSDLLEANKKCSNKVKLLMRKGCKKVGSSAEKINYFFGSYDGQWAEDGTRLLKDLKDTAIPSVLKHFPSIEELCMKMTVLSLITILIHLEKAKSDDSKEALEACRQVWDLLSFADECDIDLQANKISLLDGINLNRDIYQVCMAVEREFCNLQMKYNREFKLQMKYVKPSSACENCVIDVNEARSSLENLLEDCKELLTRENLLGDSNEEVAVDLSEFKDWMKIAPSYNLYKLCKLMLSNKDIEDFVKWTRESLRDVIVCCLSRLPGMFVKQCWKWAQEFEEDKLWEAIQLAGKCRGMMEAWDRD